MLTQDEMMIMKSMSRDGDGQTDQEDEMIRAKVMFIGVFIRDLVVRT
jgi:hypothetical protein